ncbi:hypothetical protein Tel_09000 [Candidatus Tenderia electrophaga]|uniref:Carboxypeptidase regulatory-like domain-containing protein n=1 Tax=Candidatus Tenderia electrophaga TaxID=1748243 RepID=A0A0S2TDT5_9GAMM|nr:hypothetical protein Tel_09000 [Candidatus Tenderia electrophaga]
MSDVGVIKTFAQVAGLGGLALVLVLFVFRDVIRKDIFARLTKRQSYQLFRLIIIVTSLLSVTGMGAWVYVSQDPPKPTSSRVVISGSVSGPNGEPLRGVIITADHYPFRAVSNTDGSFAESLLLPQRNEPVTLRAYHEGYLTSETSITVAQENPQVDIVMKERP